MKLQGMCIGGPLDGTLYKSDHHWFRVSKPLPAKALADFDKPIGLDDHVIEFIEYRAETLAGRHRRFIAFVEKSLSIDDALERLLMNYRPIKEAEYDRI